ncbi:hypothetical protein [Azospirillum sp. TSO5]|uniref:hypothetical protein n=1 Tax=Azospirillum sp. TSO5 TaxID=716760 RepID=UPI000D614AD9|nr:hypothetical protein [Azospirillum sp. TSO5]PWC93001.1 hypothetical protein TSO5_16395 [Azospirillum sp. TSO5]
MDEPRHPTENPYWHELDKPHVVDRDEIRNLCLDCLHVVLASGSMPALWVDDDDEDPAWEFPNLAALHHRSAEAQLSRSLLKLAVLVRTFDDQCRETPGYLDHRRKIDGEQGPFGSFHEGDGELGIRESCNKIIHADDFRPVYDNGSAPRDEGVWSMDGIVELTGRERQRGWLVGLNVLAFLEAAIDLVSFGADAAAP